MKTLFHALINIARGLEDYARVALFGAKLPLRRCVHFYQYRYYLFPIELNPQVRYDVTVLMNSLNNNIISCNNSLAYRNLRRSPKCKSTRYRSGDYAPSPNALPSKNTLHQAPIVVSYNTALS